MNPIVFWAVMAEKSFKAAADALWTFEFFLHLRKYSR